MEIKSNTITHEEDCFILTSLIVVLCSCSKNEVEVEVKEKTDNDSIVVVYSNDRTSNGMTFYEIDFDNFYLDNVKYTFTYPLQGDAHLVVSGYNKDGDCSNLKIVSAVEMDGTIFKVLKIAENAFQGCSNMTSLKLPKGLITIGDYAFKGCDRLTSINIPESVTEIDYDAFSGCDNLDTLELHADKNWLYSINYLNSIKNVIFGDGVHKIQSYAFKNWASLTSISLSNSVEEINYSAFWGCNNLKTVYCEALTPPSVHSAFKYPQTQDMTLYVPSAAIDKYKAHEVWKQFKNILPID